MDDVRVYQRNLTPDELRYLATGDITLGSLVAPNVRVEAGDSIIDGGETDVDVVSTTAQLVAATSIGEAAGTNLGPIDTTVGTLAASAAAGNIYLSDTTSLIIGSVAAIPVNRVQMDSTAPSQAGVLLEGASGADNVKVESAANLTVSNSVTATDEDLLLSALGGDLAVNAAVTATAGNASLLASANVTQTDPGDVTTGGTLDVNAQGGSITMSDEAVSTAPWRGFRATYFREDRYVALAGRALTLWRELEQLAGETLFEQIGNRPA